MTYKKWNWKHKQWPRFSYSKEAIQELEHDFIRHTGTVLGVLKHIKKEEKEGFLVDILSNEALKTSEIEGEYLDRDSVQSSIKKNLGFMSEKRKIPPAEYGISEMMMDLYLNYHQPCTQQMLFKWHQMIVHGRRDIADIGRYRTHKDVMQIVSGRLDSPTIHFEAPPSDTVPQEMRQFISWFNTHHFDQKQEILPLAKAGIAHLYFVSIHPFEDGNGRIGRAIAQKSIALSTGRPALISLSQTIQNSKKEYYTSLEIYNTSLEITNWLVYFGKTILKAQKDTLQQLDFLIEKTKFFDRYSSQMNGRQLKVVQRLFKSGHIGFKGGLSAENYVRIAKISASTATRDLKDLVEKQILFKTGTLKSTRYHLNLKKKL